MAPDASRADAPVTPSSTTGGHGHMARTSRGVYQLPPVSLDKLVTYTIAFDEKLKDARE
ncbi:hypothetical protein OIO90_006641, partial [Microbotryomycetes sp. JL221]